MKRNQHNELIKSIQKSKLIQHPLVLPWARALWNSAFLEFWKKSNGNVWYPLFALRWLITSWLTPRKDVDVDGVRFSIGCTNWITHWRWYLYENKEPEVRYFFDRNLTSGDTVFDVGANIGVFSLYVAALRRDSTVYAIEPEISNIARLRENILANAFQEWIKPICAGVNDRVGITRLFLSSEEPGAAVHSISDNELEKTHLGYDVVGREAVISVTLDYLAAELGTVPNLIKIDTDGNEKKILSGARVLLSDPRLRAFMIEMPMNLKEAEECRMTLSASGFIQSDYPYPRTLNEIWVRL